MTGQVAALIRPAPARICTLLRGGVSERPKERASKAREGQPSEGSNPSATASKRRPGHRAAFLCAQPAKPATGRPATPGLNEYSEPASGSASSGRFSREVVM